MRTENEFSEYPEIIREESDAFFEHIYLICTRSRSYDVGEFIISEHKIMSANNNILSAII